MCGANLTLPMPQDTPALQGSMVVAESSCRDASHPQGLGIFLELKKEWKEQYRKYCMRTCFSPLKTEAWEEIHLSAGQWSQGQGQSNIGVTQEQKINVLPSQSPFLNPIENLNYPE